ncbi:MAG TPA: Rieske (2Fe-2S) protein [Blastocatellia bacterium]|nr:Rieske (2Fe-2S) protein [Blastocatellia bacterium]
MKAPPPEAFPSWPAGWYFAAQSDRLGSSPVGVDLFGRRLVCYRTASGHPAVMDARCWHMGADLSRGAINGDRIVCPFHGWQYGASGKCESIPAQAETPHRVRQQTYSSAECCGRVFVFPEAEAAYPFPFFAGISPADLVPAPAFEFIVNCPWWLVSANGFDVQHFAVSHDRRLVSEAILESPHPFARRMVTTFEVCGHHWRDRLTRKFAGAKVTMDVTIWSGTLAFVIARFHDSTGPNIHGATSFGMTEVCPLGSAPDTRSLVRVTIFRRRRARLKPIDWIDVRIKQRFIRSFLETDVATLDGARYDPDHLIRADNQLVSYLHWLASASRGAPARKEHSCPGQREPSS